MHGLVALDAAGRVLRPAILWNDQRTAAECAEIEAAVGLERLIALTGNRALPGFTAPKLLWLRRHEPEAYAAIARVMLPKDYVRLRLCGEWATDVSDASGTLLLDVARRRWSEEVLEALSIDPAILPVALEGVEVLGRDRRRGAGRGRRRRPGGGRGRRRRRPARAGCRSRSGPRASCSRRSTAFAADPRARVHAFCHAVPGAWHVMGVMLSAAGSLRWLRDTVGARVGLRGAGRGGRGVAGRASRG